MPLWNVQVAYRFVTSNVVGAVWLSVTCLENLEMPSNFSCTTVADKPAVMLGGLQAVKNASGNKERLTMLLSRSEVRGWLPRLNRD